MVLDNILRSGRKCNPFFYNGINIPDKYFCDRRRETEKLKELLLNGNNVVLKAPRRIGKSSLIFHLFKQSPFKREYNTIYVDIYPTKTVDDFLSVFYKSIAECDSINRKSVLEDAQRRLKEISVSAELTFPAKVKLSGTGQYETYKVEKSLDVMFEILSKTSKPNLIVIDEFQQIRLYKEAYLEASLRSFIQKTDNCTFIFSGSSRHMLTQIFESSDKPFYRSSRTFNLSLIAENAYMDFCRKHFKENGKDIDRQAVHFIYTISSGSTFMMQQIMNSLFLYTEEKSCATKEDAENIIGELIDEKHEDYRTFLHSLKPNFEKVLLCIAAEGICEGIYSEETKRKFYLGASSTVSNILKYFQSENSRVAEELAPNVYKLEDKFLELWIAKYIFGTLEAKFESAEHSFELEMRLRTSI